MQARPRENSGQAHYESPLSKLNRRSNSKAIHDNLYLFSNRHTTRQLAYGANSSNQHLDRDADSSGQHGSSLKSTDYRILHLIQAAFRAVQESSRCTSPRQQARVANALPLQVVANSASIFWLALCKGDIWRFRWLSVNHSHIVGKVAYCRGFRLAVLPARFFLSACAVRCLLRSAWLGSVGCSRCVALCSVPLVYICNENQKKTQKIKKN